MDKIYSYIREITDKVRVFFFYLGVHLSSPISLVSLIYIASLMLWRIFEYVGESTLKIPFIFLTVFISFIFLLYIVFLMFPPARQVRIIIDAYGNNPRIISFVGKKVKLWLKKILNSMEKYPTKEEIMKNVNALSINGLEKLLKKFPNKSLDRNLTNEFEKNGDYLNIFIGGTSDSLRIPRESIEELLINNKIDVDQKLGDEIITSYDQIRGSIGGLKAAIELNDNRLIAYYTNKIKERMNNLEIRKESLKAQIIWIEEFDKRKKVVKDLLEIIKEPSTGKAVAKLSRLLLSEEVTKAEDFIWLIRFANSRKGVKIGNLLGLYYD